MFFHIFFSSVLGCFLKKFFVFINLLYLITHYCWNCLYKVWLLLVILHNYNSFFEVFIHLLNLTCRLSQWQLLLLFFLCMVYAFHFCFICLTIILTFGYFRYFFVRSLDYCCWLFILLLFFFQFLCWTISVNPPERPPLIFFLRIHSLGHARLSWD